MEKLMEYENIYEEYDESFKERLILIIEKAMHGELTSNADAAMLFHWIRHQDEPRYAFVPEKYRR